MAPWRLLAAVPLLLAATLGAGCLEQVRDSVGAQPSHEWRTKAIIDEEVSLDESLTSGSAPTQSRSTSFSVPFGSTAIRMTVDVQVPSAGNVTVLLQNPSQAVYDEAFSESTEDTYQAGDPETGSWTVDAQLRGEAEIRLRVDARVPVG